MRFMLVGLAGYAGILALLYAIVPHTAQIGFSSLPSTVMFDGVVREHDMAKNTITLDIGKAGAAAPHRFVRINYSRDTEWLTVVQEIRNGVFISQRSSKTQEQNLTGHVAVIPAEVLDTLSLHAFEIQNVVAIDL